MYRRIMWPWSTEGGSWSDHFSICSPIYVHRPPGLSGTPGLGITGSVFWLWLSLRQSSLDVSLFGCDSVSATALGTRSSHEKPLSWSFSSSNESLDLPTLNPRFLVFFWGVNFYHTVSIRLGTAACAWHPPQTHRE